MKSIEIFPRFTLKVNVVVSVNSTVKKIFGILLYSNIIFCLLFCPSETTTVTDVLGT